MAAYGLRERGFTEEALRRVVMRMTLQPVAGRLQLLYRLVHED
jgi:hypothetical protein